MHTRCLVPVVFIAALAVSACGHINAFELAPRAACAGDGVTATWAASGDTSIAATPPVPGAGSVPRSGSKTFPVQQSTRFVLQAARLFGTARAEQDVDVAPPQHAYGEVAQCSEADRLMRTRVVLDHQLAPEFTVLEVRNVLDRPLSVLRDGHQVTLAPGGESAKFRGVGVVGTWTLESALQPRETCAAALRSVRQRLQIQISLACGE